MLMFLPLSTCSMVSHSDAVIPSIERLSFSPVTVIRHLPVVEYSTSVTVPAETATAKRIEPAANAKFMVISSVVKFPSRG